MDGYQGTIVIEPEQTEEFAGFGPTDWAMYFITSYGQIDGAHHRAWVLDQVARILKGTPVIVQEARWVNDQHPNGYSEYRVNTGEPSPEYLKWVADQKEGGYDYDEGIAP